MLVHVHDVAATRTLETIAEPSTQHTKNDFILANSVMNLALAFGAQVMLACAHASEVLYMVGDSVTTVAPASQFSSATVSETSQCPTDNVISDRLTDYISSPETRVIPIAVSACGSYLLSDLVSGLDWIKYNIDYDVVNYIAFGIDINDTISSPFVRDRVEQFVRNRAIVSVAEGMWINPPEGVYTIPIKWRNHTSDIPIPGLGTQTIRAEQQRYERILQIAIVSELGFFALVLIGAIFWCIVCRRRRGREDRTAVSLQRGGQVVESTQPRADIGSPAPLHRPPSTGQPSLCVHDSFPYCPSPFITIQNAGDRCYQDRVDGPSYTEIVAPASKIPGYSSRSESREPAVESLHHQHTPRQSPHVSQSHNYIKCTTPPSTSQQIGDGDGALQTRASGTSFDASLFRHHARLDRSRSLVSGRVSGNYQSSPFNKGPTTDFRTASE
jgi:hypothetical protein